MFVSYRSEGLIFKKEDRGENDQLLTVYTKDFGKLEILAKAIRKISSKLRAAADIFYLSEVEFIQGKTYKTLTDAILIDKFQNLRNSLKKLAIAYRISEVFDGLVKGQEPDPKIWQLLNKVFEELNNLKLEIKNCPDSVEDSRQGRRKLEILYYYFLWNLFAILGYTPELYSCLRCQKKLMPKNLYFNLDEGGIICQNCFHKIKSGRPRSEISLLRGREINPEIVKILRIILKKDWHILSRLKMEKSHLKTLNIISKEYYSHISTNA